MNNGGDVSNKQTTTMKNLRTLSLLAAGALFTMNSVFPSSHREAPLIANDPLADNTDVYAFRSPDDPNSIIIIANYVPMQLPQGGPNYYSFGENIRYEVHIDNNIDTPGDDIIYRFTFTKENQDPTTFFNVRLGQQNLKTTYLLERSIDGGQTFIAIKQDVTQRKKQDEVIQSLATRDVLTGLPNQAVLREDIERIVGALSLIHI